MPLTLVATLIFLFKRDPVWKKWLLGTIIAATIFVIALIAIPLPNPLDLKPGQLQ